MISLEHRGVNIFYKQTANYEHLVYNTNITGKFITNTYRMVYKLFLGKLSKFWELPYSSYGITLLFGRKVEAACCPHIR